ncbi:MAG: MBL fold metallo-hydrolase, partial [Vicinamibacteria bacterium]
MIGRILLFALLSSSAPGAAQTASGSRVKSVRVLVLSTMLTESRGVGEWGFGALVEFDGHRLLFDTGSRPQTVLANSRELGVDLSEVEEVVLSHNHSDHTGGLFTLRRELSKSNPKALSRAHVGRGIFWERPGDPPETSFVAVRKPYEALGGTFL